MIKITLSAIVGAAIGAYAVSNPAITVSLRRETANAISIDPTELTKQAKNLPVLEVREPF